MLGAADSVPAVCYLAEAAPNVPFNLVDIGVGGGLHPVWRQYGSRLRAIGIDPNVQEIDRLRKAETADGVTYVAGFAGLPPEHPFLAQKGSAPDFHRNPWHRLAVARSMEILQRKSLSTQEQTEANLWQSVPLADQTRLIILPEYLRENKVPTVDFIKIDVDGKDYEILHSLDTGLADFDVLGLVVEVIFVGSDSPTDHTFHNTDRYLKARGFELYNLEFRRYASAALPSKYVYHLPSESEAGRLTQGDALYMRDLCSPENAALVERLGPEKLLNAACIFATFNLPDCAAEILVEHRKRLDSFCDIDKMLDMLADQAQGGAAEKLSYKQWMESFEANDPRFYTP